jgi:hypothetical protein
LLKLLVEVFAERNKSLLGVTDQFRKLGYLGITIGGMMVELSIRDMPEYRFAPVHSAKYRGAAVAAECASGTLEKLDTRRGLVLHGASKTPLMTNFLRPRTSTPALQASKDDAPRQVAATTGDRRVDSCANCQRDSAGCAAATVTTPPVEVAVYHSAGSALPCGQA